MNPLWSSYSRYTVNSQDNPIEALQTDVMRFMAILGLCLMAIFSIVQSLSFQAQPSKAQILLPDIQQQTLQQLQQRVTQLQQTLEQLQQTISEQKRLQEQQSALQQQHKQQIEQLKQRVAAQNTRLLVLEQHRQQQQHDQKQLQQQLEREQQQHQQHVKQLQHLQAQPVAPTTENAPVETQTTVQTVTKKDEKIGFSLRFQSNEALFGLMRQNHIGLYLKVGKQSWQIVWRKGVWQAVVQSAPPRYYQMATGTVPASLQQTINQQLALNRSHDVIWGVDLPKTTEQAIRQAMQKAQGGELVIDPLGQVLLTP